MNQKFNLIIPAAGNASRLRPISSASTSKAMVRINGKPCIEYIFEAVGKPEITVIVDNGKNMDIREFCEKRNYLPRIEFAVQDNPIGPGDAITRAFSKIPDDKKKLPLVIWLGDTILTYDISDLIGSNFLLTKKVDDQENWCMWNTHRGYFDKPTRPIENAVALIGVYGFESTTAARLSFEAATEKSNFEISAALINYQQNKDCFANVRVDGHWYDIGNLTSFHKTRAALLSQKCRGFHRFEYIEETSQLKKTATSDDAKVGIDCEKRWYKNVPEQVQPFIPRLFDSPRGELIISYEPGVLLSDLMLYENMSESAWNHIINRLMRIVERCFIKQSHPIITPLPHIRDAHWYIKTSQRLNRVSAFDYDLKEQVLRFVQYEIIPSLLHTNCMHGDLHFGNILYDPLTDNIRFIDPRGEYGEGISVTGDNLYDLAKLSHDLEHGYSALVANTEPNEIVRKLFRDYLNTNFDPKEVKRIHAAGLILLMTCIPLHADNPSRQKRMIEYTLKAFHGRRYI